MSRPEHFLNPWQKPEFVRPTNDRPLRLSDVVNIGNSNRPQTMAEAMNQMKSTLSTAKDWTIGRPEELITRAGESDQINTPFGSITYPAGSVDALAAFPLFGRGMEMFRGALRTTKPYFSQLRRTIEERMPERASAEQIMNLARKGSKAEELEWSGLEEMLAVKIPYSKDKVLEYLDAAAPELRERWLVEPGFYTPLQREFDSIARISPMARTETQAARIDELDEFFNKRLPPRYANQGIYTTPGRSNYRELVVTLPNNRTGEKMLSPHAYGSSEYDRNRLFHIRLSDFEKPDGGKILLVEELQSDWIQKGQALGFKSEHEAMKKIREGTRDIIRPFEALALAFHGGNAQRIAVLKDLKKRLKPEEFSKVDEFQKLVRKQYSVPDAPFKNNWHELGMKRVIQEAIDGGYDTVAWTTGKAQRARWHRKLEENIDAVTYNGRRIEAKRGDKIVASWDGISEYDLEQFLGSDLADKLLMSEPYPDGVQRLMGLDNVDVGDRLFKTLYDRKIKSYMEKVAKKHGSKVKLTETALPGKYMDAEGDVVNIEDYVKDYLEAEIEHRRGALIDTLLGSDDAEGYINALVQNGIPEEEIERKIVRLFEEGTLLDEGEKANYLRAWALKSVNVDDITREDAVRGAIETWGLRPATTEHWSMDITPQMRKAISEEGQTLFTAPPVAPLIPRDDEKNQKPTWSRPTNK